MNEKEGRTEEEEIKTKHSNGTASKHVMVKSRFFFFIFFILDVRLFAMSSARDWAIFMQRNLTQVHSLYTANGFLSLFSLYFYLRLCPFSCLFFFFFIAFSVVVCCWCCFCWRPRGNSDERESHCPEMAARDGVCFRPAQCARIPSLLLFFKIGVDIFVL